MTTHKHNKGSTMKTPIIALILSSSVSLSVAATHNGSLNTGNFNLQDGVTQREDALFDCSGRQCVFNEGNSSAITHTTTNAATGATSTLTFVGDRKGQQPNNSQADLFKYGGKITVNQGSHLQFFNFAALTPNNKVDIEINGGKLTFSGNQIPNAQGEDRGNFTLGNDLILQNGATLNIDNVTTLGFNSFLENRQIKIDSTSKIITTNTPQLKNTQTINNNGTITHSGHLINYGQNANDGASTATINNKGTISIAGDFHNGNVTQVSCALAGCGAGVVTNEGTISVGGSFYNKKADNGMGTDLYSSVELKGGTLTLNNGSGTFFNEAGNTLKFSANNGKMGKLDGNLENTNGKVVVNVAGVDLKKEHILITGYTSGVDSQTLQVEVAQGQTSDLVEAHISKGANNKLGLIVMEKGATPPSLQNQNPQNPGGSGTGGGSQNPGGGSQNPSNPGGSGGNSGSGGIPSTPSIPGGSGGTAIDQIQQSLPQAQGAILGGLRDIMPNLATSVANSTQLKSFVSNVESQTQNISQAPAKVIDTIKSTRNFKPVTNFSSTRQAREAVKVASVATDSMGGINYRDISTYDPLNTTTIWSNEIDVALFGLGLSGDGTDGSMIGLNASVQKEVSDNHLLKGQLSYAYAHTKDDLETINSKTDTNVLSGGILNRFTYDNIETDIGVYATAAFSDNTQEYKIAGPLSNADSSYEFYSGELEAIVGYRFGDEFSIKPYIGVNNSYNYRTGIKQNGGVLMRADSQKYYALDGIFGAEAQYNLQSGYVYGKLEHYRTLYYSNDSMKFRLGNSDMIELLMDKDFKTTASLGFMYYYNEFINLGLETMYSIYNGGLKNYGGSLMFKYLF